MLNKQVVQKNVSKSKLSDRVKSPPPITKTVKKSRWAKNES